MGAAPMKGGVRITGGRLRGRVLKVPPGARPSGARLREALFSIWAGRVPEARFLDLFAGSGVVSFEALSRGAALAVLAESSPRALRVLEANRRSLRLDDVHLRRLRLPGDLRELARREADRYDLVFADPPYAFDDLEALLEAAEPLLAPDGELGLEHSARREPPTVAGGLERVDRRSYGESALTIYRRSSG